MTQAALTNRQLDSLVNEFVERVSGISHAMVVSNEGLKLAVSDRLDAGRADQLGAVASGLLSLTRGAARCFHAEPVQQTIVEMGNGYLFVTTISDGSALAVFASGQCDIGMVGYEMALLVAQVGQLLTPEVQSRPEDATDT